MGAHETQHTDSEAAVGNKDEAIGIVGEEQHSIDPVVAARAVRKIDLFLIPAMIVGCKCLTSQPRLQQQRVTAKSL